MTVPAWVSWVGLGEHVLVGTILTVVFGMLCPAPAVLALVVVIALVHEQAQGNFSDFRTANGGPWNGVLDVVSFLLVPAFYLLFA